MKYLIHVQRHIFQPILSLLQRQKNEPMSATATTVSNIHSRAFQDSLPGVGSSVNVDVGVSSSTQAFGPEGRTSAASPLASSVYFHVAEAKEIEKLGNLAHKAGRYGEAIDLYTRAIQISPSEPVLWVRRAASYKANRNFHQALEDYKRAYVLLSDHEIHPQDPYVLKTICRLAWCQYYLGSFTACLSTIHILLLRTAQSSSASSTIISIHNQALILQNKALSLAEAFRAFHSLKRDKKWAEASSALHRCMQDIEAQGGEAPMKWLIWKVELDIGMKDWNAAESTAKDILRLDSTSCENLYVCGLLSFFTGKLSSSIEHLTSALDFDPTHESTRNLLFCVKAVEKLQEEGNLLFKTKRWGEALEKYDRALEKVGAAEEHGGGGLIRATLLSNRATTLVKLSQHDEALIDVESSLNLNPTSFKALRTCARIHFHLCNYDLCIAAYYSALEHSHDVTHADLQRLNKELKDAEDALQRSKTKDYYAILGIPRDCNDQAAIRRAYFRQSKLYHPDKGGEEEKFKSVVEAYEVLSDPNRRKRYDLAESEGRLGATSGGF